MYGLSRSGTWEKGVNKQRCEAHWTMAAGFYRICLSGENPFGTPPMYSTLWLLFISTVSAKRRRRGQGEHFAEMASALFFFFLYCGIRIRRVK